MGGADRVGGVHRATHLSSGLAELRTADPWAKRAMYSKGFILRRRKLVKNDDRREP